MNKINLIKSKIHPCFDDCQVFFTRNIEGDEMTTLYEDDNIQIDKCFNYGYYEIFGLDYDEQTEIKEWFEELRDNFTRYA